MRKVANVKINNSVVKRVLIHESKDGVFLFHYASLPDGSTIGDQWYPSVVEAEAVCFEEFGVDSLDWQYIDDPEEGCQQDWIASVRVKGRNIGQPQWGQLERFEDGVWVEVKL